MGLNTPITQFGIHQATIEDRTTKDRLTLKVVGGGQFNPSQSAVPLNGGSQPFAWDVEHSYSEGTIDLEIKQYDTSVLKYFAPFLADSLTEDTNGDAAGATADFANLSGTTVFDATTGIASVAIKSGATPKFGSYILKAADATTIDIYADNDLDGAAMQDDNLKITSVALTVPGTDGTVDESTIGITITGGSGTVAFNAGDMARVTIKPINNYNYQYLVGQVGQVFQEFSLTIFSEKISNNKYRALHLPRVKASGTPISFNEKDWSTFTANLTVMYDSSLDYAAKQIVYGR